MLLSSIVVLSLKIMMDEPADHHVIQTDEEQAPELRKSDPPLNHGPRNTEDDNQDKFWAAYLTEAKKYDDELLETYKTDIETVVFFAGLFSAVVAGFLAALQPALSPNPSDTTNALLMILIHTIDNSTFSDQPLTVPRWNGAPYTVVWSQSLGYVSLSLNLSAAVGAVVGKQWLSNYGRLGTGTAEAQGRRRQQKLEALGTWKFRVIMELLPALLQAAFALFAIALCINLWETNRIVALALICATALSGLAYLALTIASLWFPSCPYETPLAAVIRWMVLTATETSVEFRGDLMDQERIPAVRLMVGLSPFLLLPVFGWGTIILSILTTLVSTVLRWIMRTPCLPFASRILYWRWMSFIHQWKEPLSLSPQYLDLSSGAWILELSTRHDDIATTVERFSDAAVQSSHGNHEVAMQRLTRHLCHLFIGSVDLARRRFSASQRDRALAFGKALVCILRFGVDFKQHSSSLLSFQDKILFKRLLRDDRQDAEIKYFIYLMFMLLPIKDIAWSTRRRPQIQPIDQIPQQSLLWSLSLFRQNSANLQPSHWDQHLMSLFALLYPTLGNIRFSDGHERSALELSLYLKACQAFFDTLGRQNSDVQSGQMEPSGDDIAVMRPLGDVHWNIIYQVLTNLCDTDESLRLKDDFPKTLHSLSKLLIKYPSWPDDIQTSVHKLAFGIFIWAKDLPMQVPLGNLLDRAISLAATNPRSENYIDPKVDQILHLLFHRLVKMWRHGKNEPTYVLKIAQACSAGAKRSVSLRPDFATHIVNCGFDSDVLPVTLEILSAACESGPPDDVLGPLISHDEFYILIQQAIDSQEHFSRMIGLRFLDAALLYVLRNKPTRATWPQESLERSISRLTDSDASSPESPFRLIRIKCALCPDECSAELSDYWRGWTKNQTALEVARVVPVARWVLAHCEPSPRPQAWYTELRGGFEGLLRVAWGGSFARDDASVLRGLVDCTEKWLQTVDDLGPRDVTIAVVQDAARQILENKEKYGFGEDDVDALQSFINLK